MVSSKSQRTLLPHPLPPPDHPAVPLPLQPPPARKPLHPEHRPHPQTPHHAPPSLPRNRHLSTSCLFRYHFVVSTLAHPSTLHRYPALSPPPRWHPSRMCLFRLLTLEKVFWQPADWQRRRRGCGMGWSAPREWEVCGWGLGVLVVCVGREGWNGGEGAEGGGGKGEREEERRERREGKAYPKTTDARARVLKSPNPRLPAGGADIVESDSRPIPWSSDRAPYSGTLAPLPRTPPTLSTKLPRTSQLRA